MNDCWTVVAKFLDIQERGRLYTTLKIHHSWDNLVHIYLHTHGPPKLIKKMVQKNWSFLKKYCHLDRQLCLPCGIETACWSPWCSHHQLRCTPRGVSVMFDPRVDDSHGRFVLWVRKISQRNDSLKVATRLTANTKWKPEYTLPLKDGTCIPIMQVLNRNFRVKLKIQRVYYKIINDGYPKLIIQHFEIK